MNGRRRLEPPVTDRALLARPRLLDRLAARWRVPVTVVASPAGFGKTTLVAQAAAANAAAPAGIDRWAGGAPADGAASSLAAALLGALDAPPPPATCEVAAAARSVADAMWRLSPQQVAVTVDDAHDIADGTDAAHLLAEVVAALPRNGHLVLVGRSSPPLALARLEVAGRLAWLGEDDLAFTRTELVAFARLRGVDADLVAGCGGWPAMAELSASARRGIAADYVGEEVVGHLPAARRRDLALLAHVGPVDDALAGAVLGHPVDLADLLADLPLVHRESAGSWSLHGLWADVLDGEVTPEEIARARRRAGRALHRGGRNAAAVRLLIDAEAWDDLGEVIVDALSAAHPPVDRGVLAAWCARLPAPARARPAGRLLAAVVAVGTDPDGAADRLEEAAAAFRDGDDRRGELACIVQLAQLAWWSEEPERLARLARRVFELESAGCAAAVPMACLARALVHDVANDSPRVLDELDRIPPGTLNSVWQGVVSWMRSTTSMHLGEAGAALAAADDAVARANAVHAPLAEGARLQARWFLGETAAVAAALPDLAGRLERTGHRGYTALATAQCAIVDAFLGRVEQAEARLGALVATVDAGPRAPLVDTDVALARAALAVAAGDDAAAAAVLRAQLDRHPLDGGHSAAPHQRSLALFHVLVPETREHWDGTDLGPTFLVARRLARALVALRTDGRLPPLGPGVTPLPDAGGVLPHLPLRWATELALGAVAAGRDDGWRLLEGLWPAAHGLVAASTEGDGRTADAARRVLGRLPVPPTGHLDLRLLGPVELRRDGGAVVDPDWRRERVRSLLAHLALHGTVSRARLADDLWPGLDGEGQSRNLRVTLTYLLRVLEPARGAREASFFLRQDGGNVTLHAGEALRVDVWDFDRAADRADEADRAGDPAEALAQGRRAVELWRDEPTELVSEPWAIAEVERRRQRVAALAVRTGELLLARGATASADALAQRALAADPWMEGAHRLLVATHRSAGDHGSARRALDRYRSAIADLGMTPDEATLMVERLVDDTAPVGAERGAVASMP